MFGILSMLLASCTGPHFFFYLPRKLAKKRVTILKPNNEVSSTLSQNLNGVLNTAYLGIIFTIVIQSLTHT